MTSRPVRPALRARSHRPQSLGAAVDGSREAGRSAADDHDVVAFLVRFDLQMEPRCDLTWRRRRERGAVVEDDGGIASSGRERRQGGGVGAIARVEPFERDLIARKEVAKIVTREIVPVADDRRARDGGRGVRLTDVRDAAHEGLRDDRRGLRRFDDHRVEVVWVHARDARWPQGPKCGERRRTEHERNLADVLAGVERRDLDRLAENHADRLDLSFENDQKDPGSPSWAIHSPAPTERSPAREAMRVRSASGSGAKSGTAWRSPAVIMRRLFRFFRRESLRRSAGPGRLVIGRDRMATTDFGPAPLSASDAIARLATMDRDESHYDGNATLTLKGADGKPPEFSSSTELYFVNGIANDVETEIGYAARFAGLVHADVHLIHVATFGIPSDLEKATREKLSSSYSDAQPPEQAVARAVLAHLNGTPAAPAFRGDVHFAAHSRGALVVERGLELAARDMATVGYTPAQTAALFAHVGVETYGGAASSFPNGVRGLHYVNDRDPVGLGFGMGPLTARTAEAIGVIGAFNAGAAAFVAGYEIERALTLHPQGPVVLEPGKSEANPVDELLHAHGATGYLDARTPFEQTRAAHLGRDAAAETRAAAVRHGVERLVADGGTLPPVVRADAWDGRASTGTVVALDGAHVAQHLGRGAYALFETARDLHGVTPPSGALIAIARDGTFTSPAQTLSRA